MTEYPVTPEAMPSFTGIPCLLLLEHHAFFLAAHSKRAGTSLVITAKIYVTHTQFAVRYKHVLLVHKKHGTVEEVCWIYGYNTHNNFLDVTKAKNINARKKTPL